MPAASLSPRGGGGGERVSSSGATASATQRPAAAATAASMAAGGAPGESARLLSSRDSESGSGGGTAGGGALQSAASEGGGNSKARRRGPFSFLSLAPAAGGAAAAGVGGISGRALAAVFYGVLNLSSVVTIVLANKVVMSKYGFAFPVALTFLHSSVTALGMRAFAAAGVFTARKLPLARVAPVAAAYVGFVVFNNLSIQHNTVGFYQISKIMITPVVVLIERVAYGKTVSRQRLMAIGLLMLGITLATVTDAQVASNPLGIGVACGAVLASALYQVWAGTKQRELGVSGDQLLHEAAPVAAALLLVLIPLLEPVGWGGSAAAAKAAAAAAAAAGGKAAAGRGTLLAWRPTPAGAAWITASCGLGLLVNLSTYAFVGLTSALTYNVVGHLKTVFIVTSGVVFFGDTVAPKKLLGLALAMGGIVWYTSAGSLVAAAPPPPATQPPPSPTLPQLAGSKKDGKEDGYAVVDAKASPPNP